MSFTKLLFFADRKSKMAAIAGHRLTLDPMGKCSNAFFSETTNMIKAKLYMNVHWTTILTDMINIGPYGKMFKCLLLRNYKYD